MRTRVSFARLGVAAMLVAILGLCPARADVRLPHVFGSHMVLQRHAELPVWGWAEPGEKVIVTLADAKAEAEAGADGQWQVRLPPVQAGGPHQMTVQGTNSITFDDILIGEVWVAQASRTCR